MYVEPVRMVSLDAVFDVLQGIQFEFSIILNFRLFRP